MNSNPPVHLEIQRKGPRAFGLLRSTFREDGKIKHKTHGRISNCPYEHLKLIQAAFRRQAIPADSPDALQLLDSNRRSALLASKSSLPTRV